VSRTGLARYQRNDVFALSPAQQVVLLYGHTLASLRQAARHLERNEIEARTLALTKAREILGELLTVLDFENGGDLALSLAKLYAWFIDELMTVDRTRDAARLARVTGMVADLHGSWVEAVGLVADSTPSHAIRE
jgi:flagellar protein FliS